MTYALPTDRDPTAAEWQAFLDALPAAPGATTASTSAASAPEPVTGKKARGARAAKDKARGGASPPSKPTPPAWLKYVTGNAAPDGHEITPEGVPVPHFTPWQPTRARLRGWSAVAQRWFIAELTRIGSARAAAAAVGKSVASAYALRAKHGAESFAAAWDEAVLSGRQAAEQVAIERALHGELAPRFVNGKFMGYSMQRNDRLLVAALGSSKTRGSRAPGLDEYRDSLERWETALNRRMLDLEEGVYLPDEQVGAAWDARQAWERAAARERHRLERRKVEAHARDVTRRCYALDNTPPPGPRVRSL